MFDSPARIWERAGEVLVVPSVPLRSFIDQIKIQCPSARYSNLGWSVAPADAECVIHLLREYFPVITDHRSTPALPPAFEDGACSNPFALFSLLPLMKPLVPALQSITEEFHEARATLSRLAAIDPQLPVQLGFQEGLDHWTLAYTAKRFWLALLANLEQIVSTELRSDGAVLETITAESVTSTWLAVRHEICGDIPTTTGTVWFPPRSSLPEWVLALLAWIGEPVFTIDSDIYAAQRVLPAWPLRRGDEIHSMIVKDIAHWPISACLLPSQLSPDRSDMLLHLSCVNGVSKNRALWATILDGKRESLPLRIAGVRYTMRRTEGRQQYLSTWNDEPLTSSGLSHFSLTHRSAFEPVLGQSFLHLAGNDIHGTPDLALFAQQLSRAISLPFDLAWAAQLWQDGCSAKECDTPLITPLPSIGCQGYWISADEMRWMRLIVAYQRGVAPNSIPADDLSITTIGAAARISDVLEHTGEGGDDADIDD